MFPTSKCRDIKLAGENPYAFRVSELIPRFNDSSLWSRHLPTRPPVPACFTFPILKPLRSNPTSYLMSISSPLAGQGQVCKTRSIVAGFTRMYPQNFFRVSAKRPQKEYELEHASRGRRKGGGRHEFTTIDRSFTMQ